MVDTNINHVDNIEYSGYINEQTIKKCYEKLEIFLKKLSFYYDKPVIVCLLHLEIGLFGCTNI